MHLFTRDFDGKEVVMFVGAGPGKSDALCRVGIARCPSTALPASFVACCCASGCCSACGGGQTFGLVKTATCLWPKPSSSILNPKPVSWDKAEAAHVQGGLGSKVGLFSKS